MTKTKQKNNTAHAPADPLPDHEVRSIPLDQLEVDDANVRTVKNGQTIEMLADDIGFRGLIQPPDVRVLTDANGKPTGRYGILAGGRRFKALQILVKRRRIEGNHPINCVILEGGNPTDHSLAENTFREQLHPYDEFIAYKAMADQNISDADIAKRYHCTEKYVRQRMKLASASPKLLKAFKDGELSLEKLEAFCVTSDHKRQDAIFKLTKESHHYGPYQIRQALTEESINANDPRAVFVGIEAYKDAGGTVMEDFFKDNEWLENPELLDKLATEKIEAERQAILAQGFKWAEVCLDPDAVWGLKRNLSTIPNLPSALTKEERAEEKALSEEYDELADKQESEDEDDPFTPKDKARLTEIEPILVELRNRPPKLSPKQIARTGVLVSIDENGHLCLEYGFLKPEDVKQAAKAASRKSQEGENDPDADDADYGDDEADRGVEYVRADNNPGAVVANKPLSDSLARDLTSYRTVALQNEIAQDFNIAFLAALHALCASIFCTASYKTCAKISPTQQQFRGVQGLTDWQAFKDIQERHQQWGDRLPGDANALWNVLSSLTTQERGDLFAHCVSLTLDAVHGNQGRGSSAVHADQLAEAVQLDMKTAGWVSTAENYFSRVNKEQILDGVKEAKNANTAALIDHLKKPVMAKEAERLVADTDWLPALLRAPFAGAPANNDTVIPEPEASAVALPTFLSGGLNGASSAPAA